MPAPDIDCSSTTNSVNFNWEEVPGASDYIVTVLSGPTGTRNGRSYEVTGLNPGDEVTIEVIAIGTGACGNSSAQENCTAQDCPTNINITIDPVAPICLDAAASAFDLSATVSGGTGGTGTWSGVGITNTTTGTFDPGIAGVGSHVIQYTYEENNCSYDESITINVLPQPTADFDAPDAVCASDAAAITYTGNASANANFTWDFDGGTIISGSGAGPYEVEWDIAGSRTIILNVEEAGCNAIAVNHIITVEAPLAPPIISCNATTNSVEFVWDEVPGASDYQVNLVSGPAGTVNNRSYSVDNLSPGDEVVIEVVAIGTALCGNSSAQFFCTAQDCPNNVTIDLDPVAPICLSANVTTITLNASVSGGNGGGAGSWSGTGIIDADAGVFDPADAGVGEHTIGYTYVEANCSYTQTTNIEVLAEPVADFSLSGTVCEEEIATISFTGSAGATAVYSWDFDGGTIESGTGAGPYEISWADSGTKNISLTISENNCTSPTAMQNLTVEEPLADPVISCAVTTNSVEFSWEEIDGA
ncbi:MAG: hypothetical protein AAFO94_15235, partial [Bacteroidota bacterium]